MLQRAAIILFTGSLVLWGAYACLFGLLKFNLPEYPVVQRQLNLQKTVLDRHGMPFALPEASHDVHRLAWVKASEMSPHMIRIMRHQPSSFYALEVIRLLQGQDRKFFARAGLFQRFRYRTESRALMHKWHPEQILEAYLNLAFFRTDVQGIAGAAQAFFDHQPKDLTAKESEALMEVLKMPSSKLAKSKRFRSVVAPVALAAAVAQSKGTQVVTTLDFHLQRAVQEIMRRTVSRNQGAAMVIDAVTGDVFAAVGDVLRFNRADGILTPFLFTLGLDRQVVTLATPLLDSPLTDHPQQPFQEYTRAREVIRNSTRIPSVWVAEKVGIDQYVDFLKDLGFQKVRSANEVGSTVAYGQIDVRLLDLTSAFRLFVLNGQLGQVRWLLHEPVAAFKPLVSPEATYLVSQVLQSSGSNFIKCTDNIESSGQWCVGTSGKWVVGVRLDHKGEDFQTASTLWRSIEKVLPRKSLEPSRVPLRLVRKHISVAGSKEKLSELFISGTETTLTPTRERQARPQIVFPVDQIVLAVTPKRSKAESKIFFQAHPANPKHTWFLNGRTIGQVREFMAWPAQQGQFRLEIRDPAGRVVDQVRFMVKAPSNLSHGL